MSIEQVAAQAVAVVQRARGLFGSSPQPPTPGEPTLESAAQIVSGAGARASVMSGDLVDAHRGFVHDATTRLTSNGHTDASLHQSLGSAALLNQVGARQLDTITEQTRALTQAAPGARSPAAQRTLLQGLRTQVSAANTVLNTTEQQSSTLAGQIRALDYQPGSRIQATGFGQGPLPESPASTSPDQPQPAIDPRNPFVGDERFGYWQDVIPPPYVGKNPPPPWTGHRPLADMPAGGPTGFYVTGGKTWADDNAPPMAYLEEQYKFRISGVDYTGYTRTVGGQQQQWLQYTYDSQRFSRVNLGGDIWAPKGPNEITGELGGVSTGGLAGINPPPKIGPWQPMSLPQIATLSAANPTVQYYMPGGCGGQFTFVNGSPVGGVAPAPVIPSIIAAR
ncbi:hypothetical protein SKC41_28840 [Mycobacterium sp. 050128]|uniref:hypothetical protein n=1 Tax=unclassified Mycobacterium TaxID=2642494 RepID=UPI002ED7AC75